MKIFRLGLLLFLLVPSCVIAGSFQENDAWPRPLQSVPFKEVPLTEGPDVHYIDNHQPLTWNDLKILKLDKEPWQNYPEIWASYRLRLPGNFYTVVFRVLDHSQLMHSFLVIYDSSFAMVESREIMRQKRKGSYLQTHIESYSLRTNQREGSRGKTKEWLILENGELEEFNYFHRDVEKTRENTTMVEVRPLSGAPRFKANGQLYDSVPFLQSMRVFRHSSSVPKALPPGQYYRVILDWGRLLRNAQVPRQGDSLAYIRKSDVIPPVSATQYNPGEGFGQYYATYTSASTNFHPFLSVDSVGLDQAETVATESVAKEAYEVREKTSITLQFENGTELFLKDSTYQGEYTPTAYYRLFSNPAVADDFLIYAPFFEDSYFFLIAGEDGDTLDKFAGYPFYSPQKAIGGNHE